MKHLRKFSNNKKGISSLFIAIYIVLLAIIFISTLFTSITIANSSLTTYLNMEQERNQEAISIAGPGGMQLEGTNVKSLRVSNTGSITVRIRSLYIGQSFKCDPSLFDGDSYIKPKESLWIQLSGNTATINYEQTKRLDWTITTERGTTSTEKGEYILKGYIEPVQDTNKLHFGPFEITFEDFYWTQSKSIQWMPGWSVPTSTKDVIWRINITNVDNQAIILTENSCFTLVGNDNIPNNRLAWYIRPPTNGDLILQPGDNLHIYYDRNAPGSKTIPNVGKFQAGSTCINYLIFTGYYADAAGKPITQKPIAQTIPFEAVLIT